MKMKFQSINQSMKSQVNVAFVKTDGSQVWWWQNAISKFYTPKTCSRKLKLMFQFATIKPMASFTT